MSRMLSSLACLAIVATGADPTVEPAITDPQSDAVIAVSSAAFQLRADPPAAPATPADPAPELRTPEAHPAFGTADSTWWSLGGGVGRAKDATDFNLHGSLSYFVAEDVEAVGEVGVWYYSQKGTDAFGVNPSFVLRWHFYDDKDWTIYADIGIGLQLSTSDVPASGTSFNFTPRAGMGITKAIGDSGARLQLGLRWAHVSNARITGHDDNFGTDAAFLYVGVIFPY